MEVLELVQRSGDAYLQDITYSQGKLKVQIEIDDELYLLEICSALFYVNVPESTNHSQRTCFIDLIKLSDVLSVANGIYVPNDNFGKLMAETRKKLNLAYGTKASEFTYLVNFQGSDLLCSTIVRSLDEIKVQPK